MKEEMAIIETVHVGVRDVGLPVLWFGVKTLSGGSLQVMGWADAAKFIKEWDCYDIKSIEGKPCVVETDGGTMTYLRKL